MDIGIFSLLHFLLVIYVKPAHSGGVLIGFAFNGGAGGSAAHVRHSSHLCALVRLAVSSDDGSACSTENPAIAGSWPPAMAFSFITLFHRWQDTGFMIIFREKHCLCSANDMRVRLGPW